MKRIAMAVAAMVVWCAVAEVPTQSEFAAAESVIGDLMDSRMAAVKSGKKSPAEVADYAMSLVGESDTAAAKFLLARRAYGLYMKGGAFDKAAEAIGAMRKAVPDMPNERMLKTLQAEAKNVSEKKAPAVCAIISDFRGKVRSQNDIVKLESELKTAKASARENIHRQLGECHAVMGDWETALEHFAKSGGDVAAMATTEADESFDIVKAAGFWWDYSESPPTKKSVASALRQHAVELYKKGLDDGMISGLNKKLAEQRVASGSGAVAVVVMPADTPKRRIPKGLAHRWSFNGDLKDSVGNADAEIGGNGRLENGQCVLCRGWIFLNSKSVLSSFAGDFTLEIWTTELERALGARVFRLVPYDTRDALFAWATGTGREGWFHADHYAISTSGKDCKDFELGKETYVAMTCKKVGDAYEITAYKYEPHNKKFSSYSAKMAKDRFGEVRYFDLGARIVSARKFSDAISSYNECRVWTRCLSKDEIERSAKAGPDNLVL